MQQHEVDQALEFLNTAWSSGKPLAPMAAAVWGAELRKHSLDDVMRVLMSLVKTSKWRPSLAEILKPLAPASQVKSAAAAFEAVCGAIGRHSKRGGLTVLEQRAVKRLGGWAVLGRWQLDARHFQAREFAEVYDDLVSSEGAADLRALAGGQQRAIGGAQ